MKSYDTEKDKELWNRLPEYLAKIIADEIEKETMKTKPVKIDKTKNKIKK